MSELRFYLDEQMPVAIAEQLRLRGIDAVTVRDLGYLGDDDLSHLRRATSMERVVCTQDQDFLRLASQGIAHAGIAFAIQGQTSIGDWVRGLVRLHAERNAELMENAIIYIRG